MMMSDQAVQPTWRVEVFFDGECPLCLREIKFLRWLDRRKRIRFTDIAASEFRPNAYGKTHVEFSDEIHGRLPDENGEPGRWIFGVEVFRQLYAAVGFWWLVWVTRVPGISHALDFGYQVFAKNRLRLTGRCTPESCDVN